MVYCNLEKIDGSRCIYAIGGKVSDITGTLVVDYVSGVYTLVKAPENSKVYDRHIVPMLEKAADDYRQGIIKERIAYEI